MKEHQISDIHFLVVFLAPELSYSCHHVTNEGENDPWAIREQTVAYAAHHLPRSLSGLAVTWQTKIQELANLFRFLSGQLSLCGCLPLGERTNHSQRWLITPDLYKRSVHIDWIICEQHITLHPPTQQPPRGPRVRYWLPQSNIFLDNVKDVGCHVLFNHLCMLLLSLTACTMKGRFSPSYVLTIEGFAVILTCKQYLKTNFM